MKSPIVHILATVRKPELIDAALLVFRTLRTGFPSATVRVWGNALDDWSALLVRNACEKVNAQFHNLAPTSHDAWIESLIEESTEPFWICDTDIIFWQPVEAWFDVANTQPTFAGTYEPDFNEEWTGTFHVQRLHTCLMRLEPGPVRAAMREFMSRIPSPWGNTADFPFVRQHIVPRAGKLPLFYDTCAGLYHACAAEAAPFTDAQNGCFEHLHCATYADALENKAFSELHRRVYQDIEAARGIRKQQEAYYLTRKPARVLADRSRRSRRKALHAV